MFHTCNYVKFQFKPHTRYSKSTFSVGEIPKLVITPTLEAPPQPPVSNDDQKLELYDASHSSSSSSEHTNTSSLSTEK